LRPSPAGYPPVAGWGNCCSSLVGLKALVEDVPEEFVVEHSGVRCMDQHGDGACVALDPVSRLCTIYERRPQVCRDFQRAEALCRRAVLRGYGPYGTAPDAAGIAPAPVA